MNTAAFTRFLAAPTGTDADLLRRFADARDEAAFAELVRRHGGLVRGTARRLLGDAHAADDVTQAAFLLLARKAGSDGWGRTVGPWLYQVACRLARKARGRRSVPVVPRQDAPAPPADPSVPMLWAEVRAALDAELGRLPATLRDPLILCYLEGQTRDVAAAAIGCTLAVLKGRLERGRVKLRLRLERRGLTLAAGLAAVVADPGVPAVSAGAVAKLAAGGSVPPGVAALLGGTLAGWKLATAAAVGLGAVVAGAVAMTAAAPQPVPKPEAPKPEAKAEPAVASSRVDVYGDALPDGVVARLGTFRFRPGATVQGVAFSPDGRRVASWGDAMYKHDLFSLWDAADGRELSAIRTLAHTFAALAWTPDGRGFVVRKAREQSDGTDLRATDLEVWEFTAEPPARLPRPSDRPRSWAALNGQPPPTALDVAAISPDGKRLAIAPDIAGKPERARVFPLKAVDWVADEKPTATFDEPPVRCTTLAFTPDGKFLVGAGPDADAKTTAAGTVVVWDTATGMIARTIPAPTGAAPTRWLHIAASDDRVAVGLASGDTFVADLRTGAGRTVRTGHKVDKFVEGVTALAFGPGGKLLATGGDNSPIRVWDAATGAAVREYRPGGATASVAFSADGSRIAAGGQDTTLRVWDAATGKPFGPTSTNTGSAWGVGLTADGLTALTYAGGQTLRLWDAPTGTQRLTISAGGSIVGSGKAVGVGLTPDDKRVVALVKQNGGNVLKAWDTATGVDVTPPGFSMLPANGFKFTPDGTVLVTRDEGKLAAWDWPAGTKRWEAGLPPPTDTIDTLDVSADGKYLAVCGHQSRNRGGNGVGFAATLDLFDAGTGRHIHRLSRADPILKYALFATDGTLLHVFQGGFVTRIGFGDRVTMTKAEVCAIDPLTGRIVREFPLDPGPIPGTDNHYTAALSADGKILFRTRDSGGLEAIEIATGRLRTAWTGHRDTPVTMATAANEVRRVITGSYRLALNIYRSRRMAQWNPMAPSTVARSPASRRHRRRTTRRRSASRS